MKFKQDDTVSKLKLLFIMDKMEIPLTENSILDIATSKNNWLNYMECVDIMQQLIKMGFIYKIENDEDDGNVKINEQLYALTYSGRECLSHFYHRIPQSTREEIDSFSKDNMMIFKRSQEYVSEYTKNPDGSYKVSLKIKEPLLNFCLLDINLKAPTKNIAIIACNKWGSKAPNIFEYLYDNIIDNNIE